MKNMNCWEFKKCGREQNGAQAKELGVCPAALEKRVNGIHEGKNAGRCCWIIKGTYCEGKAQGSFADKFVQCKNCAFYLQVKADEGAYFILSNVIIEQHLQD